MKLIKQLFLTGVLSLLSAGLLSGLAYATTIEFTTPSNATEPVDTLPVDATAVFVTSNGQLAITLYNLEANPKAVGQNLSDLIFTISTGQTSGTLSSSKGTEITVAGNGTYTVGTSVSTGWDLQSGGTGALELNGLNGTNKATHTIIGPPGTGGTYSNANPSIAGNGPHNPFLEGVTGVEFILSIPGLTANSTIDSVIFSFGTQSGDDVTGVVASPETSSVVLFAIALLALISFSARHHRGRTLAT